MACKYEKYKHFHNTLIIVEIRGVTDRVVQFIDPLKILKMYHQMNL